ncbi:MAG TPA: PAS domain-containing protein [Thermoanaerobaculia bacterium]|nr:PAS domain-containing protein [Thermoanaerobaculia bacterium]
MALYLVREDGTFLAGNRRLRELLRLPAQGPLGDLTIESFYEDKAQRSKLIKRAQEERTKGRALEKARAHLVIQDERRIVEMFCDACELEDGGINYLGCLIDITEEERVQELLDGLPVGIFHAEPSGVFNQVNPALARLLGFKRPDEVAGRSLVDFLADPADLRTLLRELAERGTARREVVEIEPPGAPPFTSSLSANSSRNPGASQPASAIKGVLQDITEREVLRSLLECSPLGIYQVIYRDGREVLTRCNTAFARLFGFQDPAECQGQDMRALHREPLEYERFLEELIAQDREGRPLIGYAVKTRLASGKLLQLEVHCRLLRDKKSEVPKGRIGIVRDMSDRFEAEQRYQTFTRDIGNLLHGYDSLLVSITNQLPPVASTLEQLITPPRPARSELATRSEKLTETLQSLFDGLLRLLRQPEREGALSKSDRERLGQLQSMLHSTGDSAVVPEFQQSNQHIVALEVLQILRRVRSEVLPRQLLREFRERALEAAALVSLVTLQQLISTSLELSETSRSLRDFINRGIHQREPESVVALDDCLNQALSRLSGFSKDRGVSFRITRVAREARIRVRERELVRALTNILHNAVKYSWTRQSEDESWVGVRCRIEGLEAAIEIENRGVPITEEELGSGQLFQMGFRGRLAADRGRAGTGIGLADAFAVIREGGGSLTVSSRPAHPGASPHDYSRPFLTTVVVRLPLHR